METNLINNIADILENRVTSRANNASGAAQIFRDTQCVYNDYRTVKMLNIIFSYLIQKFKQEEGIIKLTNTSKHIGDIVLNILDARESNSSDSKSIMVGDFILEQLIEGGYLILTREPFFRVEDVYFQNKKKKFNYNPYILEMGTQFPKISISPAERIGMSLHKYTPWHKDERINQGQKEKLIKSNIELTKECNKKPFIKSINALENVKWQINPDVAKVSLELKPQLISTNIELEDIDGNSIDFNAVDIRRQDINKHLKDIKLYRNKDIFEPHLGNSSAVPKLEKELETLKNRHFKLKNIQKKQETQEKIEKITQTYNIENRRWTDKHYCLRIQSQSGGNKAIIETIGGNETEPGW